MTASEHHILEKIKYMAHGWKDIMTLKTVWNIGLDEKIYDNMKFFDDDDDLDEYMKYLYITEEQDNC